MHLYLAFRGSGFGAGPLPFAGGMAEQPARLMDAFHVIADAWSAMEPKREPLEGGA